MMSDPTPEFLLSQGFSPTIARRFWSKVNKTESCWLWTAYKNIGGYGQLKKGGSVRQNIPAHVLSWILHNGAVIPGLCVLHNCPGGDNPACVNPNHLWLGTLGDNNRDTKKKGRLYAVVPDRGENHKGAKLTNQKILKIRALRESGLSLPKIGILFSVSAQTVWGICKRKSWKHIS